jgi:UDP-N-acetyl-D-mannosaminuronate dehydrogenase
LKAIEATRADADCAVICTNHSSFDYDPIMKQFPLIVDTRNALRGRKDNGIFRL